MWIADHFIDPARNIEDLIGVLKPYRLFPDDRSYHSRDTADSPRLQAVLESLQSGTVLESLQSGNDTNTGLNLFHIFDQILAQDINTLPDPATHIHDLLRIGQLYHSVAKESPQLTIDCYQKSVEAFIKAQKYAEQYTQFGQMLQASGYLYLCIEEVKHFLKQPELRPYLHALIELQKDALEKNIYSYYHKDETSLNLDAWRVEQREIGFSDDAPLGTDNLQQCVALVVRDPVTCKTAVAHFDYQTDPKSISEIFKRLPTQDSPPLEVRLFGARPQTAHIETADTDSPNTHYVNEVIARHVPVLTKILVELRKRNVKILSADVLECNQPTSFVVYPKTGEVRHETPARKNPNYTLSNAKVALSTISPLQTSFDLTVCQERAPITVDRGMIKNFERGMGSLEYTTEVYGFYYCVPTFFAQHQAIEKNYILEKQKILHHFAGLAKKWEEAKLISKEDCEQVRIALLKAPICVGEHADAANQLLINFLDNDLLKPSTGKGKKATLDIRKLNDFTLPAAYKKIEEQFGTGFQSSLNTAAANQNSRAHSS